MTHVVEVDQSNKIEDSGDTFLAFSDGIAWTICVPFAVKQAGIKTLVQRGKPRKRATLMTFAACVFLLLEKHIAQMAQVTIDNEYDGREDDIKAFLLRFIWKLDPNFEPWKIEIASIGKSSPAHKRAWSAREGSESVDRVVTSHEILGVLR